MDTEVEHADILLAYADAIYASDSGELERTREQVHSRMGSGATIEADATAALQEVKLQLEEIQREKAAENGKQKACCAIL